MSRFLRVPVVAAAAFAVALAWSASAAAGDCDGDGYPNAVDPTPCGFDGADGREAPLSAALHLHGSLSEGDGSIYSQDHWAQVYDVDVLYWSDHDTMLQMRDRPAVFDFDEGALTEELVALDGTALEHGFNEVGVTCPDYLSEVVDDGQGLGNHYWHLEAEADESGDWNSVTYKYEGTSDAQILPLLAHGSLNLSVRPGQAVGQDWELVVVSQLSGNLGGTRNQIIYTLGAHDLSILDDDDELYLALQATEGVWNDLTFDLSAAAAYFPEGRDQAVREYYVMLRTREGLRVEIDIDDWTREWAVEGEALRERHRNWIAQNYANSPVTHFVGAEMTPIHAGRHVVPLGEGIPLLEYQDVIPVDGAVAYVHSQDGVAICAHPLGVQPGVVYEDEDAVAVVEEETAYWRLTHGYGCDAVEVGYPARVLGIEDYLWFWDGLGAIGLLVTGVGVSDAHWAQDWADAANTWVTWVFLDVASEDGIVDAVQAGRAFFGDPIVFAGHDPLLDLWSEHGIVMGQAERTLLDQRIHVETGYLEPGWTLALMVDGEELDSVTLVGDETDTVFDLPREHHRVVRAEIRDLDGVPILVSNPIYLLTPGAPIAIPAHRQVL
ncbi:MAG: hypothetical protein QGH45_02150 [Myxococcota bacterium]|nr:hypothetical protein [Myxococcota bacterium]